ncbi:hypothetical protein [Citrobacter cronae]|uniref:hypothetical protein n=1 Tax=Citrobacter cronae TaxID=1748967 RepID=UPI00351CCC5A
MGSNIIELAKLGHERATELKASCGAVDVRRMAQLISDLATQLEVQFVRSTNLAVQLANAESNCRELAVELHSVKSAHQDAVDTIMNTASRGVAIYTKKPIQISVSTPSTDAFLAEVRAQGADECVRQLVTSDDDDFSDAPNICAMVAYQLRMGVQS